MATEPAAAEDTDAPPETGAEIGMPPKSKKSTAAVVALRVDEILRIRLDGAEFHDVREYAGEKDWGVAGSMLRKYMEKADDLLVERLESKRKRLRAMHLFRRRALYVRAVVSADYRTALAILADESKLLGLSLDGKTLAKQVADLLARLSAAEEAARGDVPG